CSLPIPSDLLASGQGAGRRASCRPGSELRPRRSGCRGCRGFAGTVVRNGGVLLCHRTPAAEGSAINQKSRPCSLEFLYPRVRDLGAAEKERLQARDCLQVLQPSVRDLGVVEAQPPQALEFLQFLQSRVRDLGAAEK